MAIVQKASRLAPLALLLAFLCFAPTQPLVAADAVVLTVAGNITNPNRGKIDPFLDGFLSYHEKSFERAHVFSRGDLTKLPQRKVTAFASSETWHGPVSMQGPLLKDVLQKAGAGGKPVTLFALDGYGAEFDVNLLDSRDWILAHTLNGRPLGIGGRGPLWLARNTGNTPAGADEEAKWVWSVFFIEVGEK